MALLETSYTQQAPNTPDVMELFGVPSPVMDFTDPELEERFSRDRLSGLTQEHLVEILGENYADRLDGRQFVVSYIHAEDRFSDIGRSVEAIVFSEAFLYSKRDIVRDYGKYDKASVFACVIDTHTEGGPLPVGSLRMTYHEEGLGFKDTNDLLVDSEADNPWIDEIKGSFFADGAPYDPDTAWRRLGAAVGVDLKPEETIDVASHAALEGYRGKDGAIDSASMLFYHACLRFALARKAKNLIAIYDLKPFANLQQFGEPFDVYDGLEPHPYGGPYDTVPAFCVIERGIKRMRERAPDVAKIFIDGDFLPTIAMMPNEYQPELYSNQAIGLKTAE